MIYIAPCRLALSQFKPVQLNVLGLFFRHEDVVDFLRQPIIYPNLENLLGGDSNHLIRASFLSLKFDFYLLKLRATSADDILHILDQIASKIQTLGRK